ncbi:MAG TPA: tetratricopeptide repeat protein [Gemmatimonadaceae bacterium]
MTHSINTLGRRALYGAILAGGAVLSACNTDKLVAVTDPALLTPQNVTNGAAIPGLVQGAYSLLVGGYSGFGDDAFLSSSALISDEVYWGDTFTTRQAGDIRTVQPAALGNLSDSAFARLQGARINARRAFAAINTFPGFTTGGDVATKAQLRAVEAYTYVTISEGWCNSVPFSVVPDTGLVDANSLIPGSPLTTLQMNDTAIARFTDALALDPTNSFAKIGKARALLNEGRYAEAGAAVAGVPDTYVFFLEHSTNSGRENNPMAALEQNGRYGVSNLEGALAANGVNALRPDTSTATTAPSAEGLNFRSAHDPRIPYSPNGAKGNCFTSSIKCWLNNNYPDYNADVPMASGVEARLVEAEAALNAGDIVTYLGKMNGLRAQSTNLIAKLYPAQKQTFFDPSGAVKALPPLADPADPTTSAATQFAARRDLLFRERAFWMYNTGHREGDLRRLSRNYGVPTANAFPSGPYFRGGSYGNDVSYPVPFNEANNPNYNPASCSTTAA